MQNVKEIEKLFAAIYNGSITDTALYLTKLGVDVRNKEGDFPLLHAIRMADEGITNLVLSMNPNVNFHDKARDTALKTAVGNGDFELIENLLMRGADPNFQDNKGQTALHAFWGKKSIGQQPNYAILDLLLAYGADPNVPDKFGYTFVHHTSSIYDPEMDKRFRQ